MNLLFMVGVGIFNKPGLHHVTKGSISAAKAIASLIPDLNKGGPGCGVNPNAETIGHIKDTVQSVVKAIKKATKPKSN